jgi:hypothetical protein
MLHRVTYEGGVVITAAAECVAMLPDGLESAGSITCMLTEDHRRLERLLESALASDGHVERDSYDRFRAGLLRHIGIEEKILLPAAQRQRGGEPLPIAAKLRLDHGAIAALLMPTPTSGVLVALRSILKQHDALEEGPEGLYHTCDTLLQKDIEQLMVQLRTAPDVTVLPCSDAPAVLGAVRRTVERAGFEPPDDLPT